MNRTSKLIAVLCALLSVIAASAALIAGRPVPLKGTVDGIVVRYEDSSIGSTVYGGGISSMGHIEMSWHIFPSGTTFVGNVVMNKNGTQGDDYITADLSGTITDTADGAIYSATGTITGGGGAFAGATGSFTFTATQTGFFGGLAYPAVSIRVDGKAQLP